MEHDNSRDGGELYSKVYIHLASVFTYACLNVHTIYLDTYIQLFKHISYIYIHIICIYIHTHIHTYITHTYIYRYIYIYRYAPRKHPSRRTRDVVGLGLGVTVGAGVFMATGKASEEAGPAPWNFQRRRSPEIFIKPMGISGS